MNKMLGARFRSGGRIYYFGPGDYDVHVGDKVVVETAKGTEVASVVLPIQEVEDSKLPNPFRNIKRVASEEDLKKCEMCRDKEIEATKVCKEKIEAHGLDMKLVRTECAFDGAKMIFYFTADGRIDFRELVKDLASIYHTRIELRQIGVRDETRLKGGFGICGRPVCCSTYLTDFAPVSIKMAKEQNLSLNPTKISGLCGRLMCCLKNENETYEYLNSRLPKLGDTVETPDGHKGIVKSNNVLRQLVKVIIEEDDIKEEREYNTEDLKFKRRPMKKDGAENTDSADVNETSEILEGPVLNETTKDVEKSVDQDAYKKSEKSSKDVSHKNYDKSRNDRSNKNYDKSEGDKSVNDKSNKNQDKKSGKKNFKSGNKKNFNKNRDKRNKVNADNGKSNS